VCHRHIQYMRCQLLSNRAQGQSGGCWNFTPSKSLKIVQMPSFTELLIKIFHHLFFFFASITGLLGGHIKKSTIKYNDDVSCVRALPILRSWTPSSGGGGSMWSFNTRQIYGMPWKSV